MTGATETAGRRIVVNEFVTLDDEYHLYVHPVLLGEGKALFPPGHARKDLTLAGLTRYANGVLATTYERTNGADR